ncbi:MAG: glycosyltransferase 2 family protein [Solirubrobacteraceae bacterium]|jgi:uncharacterized membrane protein YbhN (UPF0104 family)|nr:glycosyltransferase 2 family protein [Solirubrobacteraceae bacterium]
MSALRRMMRFGKALSIAFMLAVGIAIVALLHGRWAEIVGAMSQLRPWAVVAAGLLLVVGLALAMASWRLVLADLGSPVDVPTAAHVFFVGQLGKYVPGAVWPALAQARMGTALGIPPGRMVAAFVISLAASVLSGLTVGLLVAPQILGDSALWLLLPAVIVVGCLVRPEMIDRLGARALRAAGRPRLSERATRRGIRFAVAISIVGWLTTGLATWFVATSLGAAPLPALLACLGGIPLATVIGSLVVIAPGGAGAREALLLLALGTVLSAPQAVVVVITSRVLSLLVDALAAGAAALFSRLQRLKLNVIRSFYAS